MKQREILENLKFRVIAFLRYIEEMEKINEAENVKKRFKIKTYCNEQEKIHIEDLIKDLGLSFIIESD